MNAKEARAIVERFTAKSLRKFVAMPGRIAAEFGPRTEDQRKKIAKEMLALAQKLDPKETEVEPETGQPVAGDRKDNLPQDRDATQEGSKDPAAG